MDWRELVAGRGNAKKLLPSSWTRVLRAEQPSGSEEKGSRKAEQTDTCGPTGLRDCEDAVGRQLGG